MLYYYDRRRHLDEADFVYGFSLDDITFTPAMAVRAGQAAFDAAPIFQGDWDGSGTPDVVSFPRGDLLGNQTEYFYSNFDPYQGAISFWCKPEWAGNDSIEHNIAYASANYRVYKSTGNALVAVIGGQTFTGPSTAAWTAGTTYHIVFSYDTKNTIDRTNYARWSLNDAHTYSVTTQPTASAPDAAIYVGSKPTLAADANIEGFVCSRVVWYDGAYGTAMWFDATGPIDIVNAIYAAGAGADVSTIVGSYDITFFLPTDQTEGPLATTGQAWSHPHGSELIDVPFVDDGGLPGTDYAVEFDGSSTDINCGSGATLDDIPSGGIITISAQVRLDADPANTGAVIVQKGNVGADGYILYYDKDNDRFTFKVELATTEAVAHSGTYVPDGKWHHVTGYYIDATQTARVALDGIWGAANAGVGAYQADAARDLYWGRFVTAGNWYWIGGIAWVEIWDNDHLIAGTDFIAPRAPTAAGPGNLIETWWGDEGTGATVTARVTTPANDGTITSGTWSSIWAVVGTPVVPQSVSFDGATTKGVVADAAEIQDLHAGAFTWEAWISPDSWGDSTEGFILNKSTPGGWFLRLNPVRGLWAMARCGTIRAESASGPQELRPDGKWHHVVAQFDGANLPAATNIYLWIDGVPVSSYYAFNAGSGAAVTDVGNSMKLGASAADDKEFDGRLGGWARLSDSLRYTAGKAFVPEARTTPPALPDANSVWQIDYSEGAGATIADGAVGGNDVTLSNYVWNSTPDLSVDEPGAQIYNQGYNVGSDGANDGIYIPMTLVASTDYVFRVPLNYSPRAWPRITLYDVTGAASLVDFDAPPLTGVHSGANNAATLTVAGEVFPASLIGAALYNVTDGSSTTITAVGGTNQDTITGVLAGGTDNDWDTNDVFYIVPYAGWVFNEPIVRRTAATTPYEVRITNRNSLGVETAHLVECLESALVQGDMEAGAGNPYIPTGWTNVDLDAGDTLAEAAIIHSGAQSLEFAVGASGEGIRQQITAAIGAYIHVSVWSYGDGSAGFTIGGLDATQMVVQSSTTAFTVATPHTAGWSLTEAEFRVIAANPSLYIMADAGAAGARYIDDVAAISDTAVSLTVVPASEANSLEGTGIRVDGRDSATVPATAHKMKARSGEIKFKATPRHSLALAQGFGQASEYLLDLTEDANNYLRLVRTTNLLTLAVNQNGAGEVTDTDATAWAADTEVLIEVINNGSNIQVKRDGATVCTVAGLVGFATDFTADAYFGSGATPNTEFDGVISAP
jgi:hypothetical protein